MSFGILAGTAGRRRRFYAEEVEVLIQQTAVRVSQREGGEPCSARSAKDACTRMCGDLIGIVIQQAADSILHHRAEADQKEVVSSPAAHLTGPGTRYVGRR